MRDEPHLRGVWLAIIVLGGGVVATLVGFLVALADAQAMVIFSAAGAAFTAVTTLGMAAYRFVTGLP